MLITEHDSASAVWQKLKKHYADRLAELRVKNDNNMAEPATIRLRAEIAEVKRFLALADAPTQIAHDPFTDQ